ncbi:trypsin-like peptidase domain-containing protein [Muricoccus pecuniae]|uniref:Trypsin-like peptidase domain-containing protein n=1 Tax=Muricoccus pecuniae TaxID=693023 RepID=A0A840XW69_9PROT|nr:trypsin-like peptidase domain-containing protein [Roseomonas pecuniae]MBB5692136.1 hypothetical protein [Roseomonas pecuniae]
MIRGRGLALLAALAIPACAAPAPVPRPWVEDAPAERAGRPSAEPAPSPRLPDIPDAFRAELRGGYGPACPLQGNAVYIGEGRFLTAAHLVDGLVPQLRRCVGGMGGTTILFGGRVLPVRPVRVGEGHVEPGIGPLYRRGQDLALLQAAFIPPGPAARPCRGGPTPGQDVLVLSARRREAVRAGAMVPEIRAADGAYADLPLPMDEGESGAGVFDAGSNCLLGIVSHRPDAEPDHSRIVPAAAIRAFLGG